MLTRGGAAPDVTDDTDESERVGQVSALQVKNQEADEYEHKQLGSILSLAHLVLGYN